MKNSIEKFYTIPETTKLLGIKPWALRRAVHDNLVPAYKFVGNRWMVKISEVEAAIVSFNQGDDNV